MHKSEIKTLKKAVELAQRMVEYHEKKMKEQSYFGVIFKYHAGKADEQNQIIIEARRKLSTRG